MEPFAKIKFLYSSIKRNPNATYEFVVTRDFFTELEVVAMSAGTSIEDYIIYSNLEYEGIKIRVTNLTTKPIQIREVDCTDCDKELEPLKEFLRICNTKLAHFKHKRSSPIMVFVSESYYRNLVAEMSFIKNNYDPKYATYAYQYKELCDGLVFGEHIVLVTNVDGCDIPIPNVTVVGI